MRVKLPPVNTLETGSRQLTQNTALPFDARTGNSYEAAWFVCIHFIGGEKGGVGKSVVRVLAQWLSGPIDPFAAVDGELSQSALIRYYGDFTTADLAAVESAAKIVDRALGAREGCSSISRTELACPARSSGAA